MRTKLNVRYRNAAEEFARKAVSALAKQLHAIVLFGSVARKQAKRDSDIDVLVVGAAPGLRDMVFDIAYQVWESSRLEAFITVVYFPRDEFQDLIRLGSPFITRVLRDGSVLYYDGSLARVRHEVYASR